MQREEREDRIAKRNSANNFTIRPKKKSVSPKNEPNLVQTPSQKISINVDNHKMDNKGGSYLNDTSPKSFNTIDPTNHRHLMIRDQNSSDVNMPLYK